MVYGLCVFGVSRVAVRMSAIRVGGALGGVCVCVCVLHGLEVCVLEHVFVGFVCVVSLLVVSVLCVSFWRVGWESCVVLSVHGVLGGCCEVLWL